MERREKLITWVAERHARQRIKKTGKPYMAHLQTVAEQVRGYGSLTFEIGLCHDLLEKTKTSAEKFRQALLDMGYDQPETEHIVNCVIELTDQFTKKAYPELRKLQRKTWEDARLLQISADAQTVKYADLLYNAEWMLEHDREHAGDYFKRKLELLSQMNNGNAELCNLVKEKLSTNFP
ncbi:MAG TPA: hypothetical protein VGM63_05725 [Mucilaginibacter sp.]|jgi:(p)ppGpp synthase/HD superfamily hydrolase